MGDRPDVVLLVGGLRGAGPGADAAGRTGSPPTPPHEVGVVEHPDGGRHAVAVFTRTAHTAVTLPAADRPTR